MSRISIYSFHLPPEGHPRELSLSEAQHEAIPDEIYQRHVSGADAVHGWIVPTDLEEFLVFPRAGDVVVFHRGETCRMVATIVRILDAPELASEFTEEYDAESLVLLGNVRRVERPLREVLEGLNPSLPTESIYPPGLLVQVEAEWAAETGIYSYVGPLLDGVERKRIYDLVVSDARRIDLWSFLLPGPESPLSEAADALEALLDAAFGRFGRLRTLKLLGVSALLVATLAAAGAELLWCGLAAAGLPAGPLPAGCLHLVTPGLVGPATTLAAVLSGALVAGTAVLAATERLADPASDEELRLAVREAADPAGGGADSPTSPVRFDDLDVREFDGSRLVEDGELSWSVPEVTEDRVTVREFDADPEGVGLVGGRYRLRRVREEVPPETALGDRGWRVTGPPVPDDLSGTRLTRLLDEAGRLDWWITPVGASPLGEVRAGLDTALAYALAASLLGAFLLWYPWSAAGGPWLAALTPVEHLLYTGASYLFAGTAVGAFYTAVDLVERAVALAGGAAR